MLGNVTFTATWLLTATHSQCSRAQPLKPLYLLFARRKNRTGHCPIVLLLLLKDDRISIGHRAAAGHAGSSNGCILRLSYERGDESGPARLMTCTDAFARVSIEIPARMRVTSHCFHSGGSKLCSKLCLRSDALEKQHIVFPVRVLQKSMLDAEIH